LGFEIGTAQKQAKVNKMKTKVGKILPLLLIIAMTALALTACFGGVDDSGSCTVVLVNGDDVQEYSVDLAKVTGDEGLFSVLEALNKDGMPLVTADGAYGKELKSVGSLNPDAAAHEYICIYTSVESDFDTSAYFEEAEYKGTRLGTSGLGASSMKIVDGGIFYLAIKTW